MRAEIGKLLRSEFELQMRAHAPEFKLQKAAAPYYWPGERVFVRSPEAPTRQVLILSPHPTGSDSFTLEIGWSRLGRLPELTTRPSVLKSNEPPFERPEFVTRLGYLDEPRWDFLSIGPPTTQVDPLALAEAFAKKREPLDNDEIRREIKKHLEFVFDEFRRVGMPFLLQAEQRS